MGDKLSVDKLSVLCDELALLVPEVEEYRRRQVNKYYRENEIEWGGDPVKMERYKNRVRVVDLFLPRLKSFLSRTGQLVTVNEDNEKDIP